MFYYLQAILPPNWVVVIAVLFFIRKAVNLIFSGHLCFNKRQRCNTYKFEGFFFSTISCGIYHDCRLTQVS